MTDLTGVEQEYSAEADLLTLPAAAAWKADPFDDASGLYEPGLGRSAADEFWLCHWQIEWLDHRTEPERAARALNTLGTFPSMHLYEKLDTTGQDWFRSGLEAARVGNGQLMSDDVTANDCRTIVGG